MIHRHSLERERARRDAIEARAAEALVVRHRFACIIPRVMSRVRVYVACSLDGFIAAADAHDLSWLPEPSDPSDDFGFAAFYEQIGAMLMGRNTYDVVAGFGSEQWMYGDRPVLVATRRPLEPLRDTVGTVSGPIDELIAKAKEAAGDRDVYIDGGDLIRQALDAGLVDELTITVVPVVIGAGSPLFAGVRQRHSFELVQHEVLDGALLKLTYRPRT